MRLSHIKILEAIGCSMGDLNKGQLVISLRNIEKTLDKVAESLDNDSDGYSLGDASNLVQLIRESI